jgi:hypothetical protein
MRQITNALAIAFLTTAVFGAFGCAHVGPPPKAPPVSLTAICLPVKAWTPDQERQMAAAVAAQPADSILVQAMADYGQMRKAAWACVSK